MTTKRSPRSAIHTLEDGGSLVDLLTAVRELRGYLNRVEADALRSARELGVSPTEMARALGVTRQGLYHKLKALEAEERPIVLPELESTTE